MRALVTGAAQAATVVGQASPAPGSTGGCDPALQFEWVQDTTDPGNLYVVPGPGVLTSWTTFADIAPALGQGGSPGAETAVRWRVTGG